jgi:glutathione S-transferase
LGKVPALQLDDGTVITQNLAIVEYLAGLGEAAGHVGVVVLQPQLVDQVAGRAGGAVGS